MNNPTIIKVKRDLLKVPTHVATFIFEKVGYIESVKDYNAEIDRLKQGRHLYKSKYGYMFEREIKNPSGCYLIFEKGKEQPSYVGKTIDIAQRFKNHICCSHFEDCTKNGEKLDVFFCSDWEPLVEEEKGYLTPGRIEAIIIGYLWHKDLWNCFN